MYYSKIYKCDTINAKGFHVSVFLSGCTHHCDGCFQPETWNFKYGKPFTDETIQEIIDALSPSYIVSLCLLGGDPLDSAEDEMLHKLLLSVRNEYSNTKSIWIWSGYTYEQVVSNQKMLEVMKYCDVLIDGEFVKELKDLNLPHRGSSNQRLISVQESLKTGQIVLLNI